MQIEAAGGEIVAAAAPRSLAAGNAPVLAVELGEFAAHGQAGELLQQQTPLAAAAQAQLAHKLLVSGFAAGGAGDPRHQFAIRHESRLGQ